MKLKDEKKENPIVKRLKSILRYNLLKKFKSLHFSLKTLVKIFLFASFLIATLLISFTFIKKYSTQLDTLTIDINFTNYQRIAFKRKQALEQKFLFPSPDDYVPAKIRYKDKTMRADIRLKGDYSGHWKGKKRSYRIKLKGDDKFKGMKKFSIQHPRERNFLHEWFFHQTLKRENIIGLRYDFIKVIINGKKYGIYAIEEHFDKHLIENNQRREGPVIKLNEDYLWEDRALHDFNRSTDLQSFYTLNVESFKKGTTLNDPVLFDQFLTACNLMELFRNGELTASQAFDISKLARYFAIIDLFGASHSAAWHNIRFYYNPVTSKLEPIGFDADAGHEIKNILATLRVSYFINDSFNPFLELFFNDLELTKEYIRNLERVSKKKYLDQLLSDLDKQIRKKDRILRSEFREEVFEKDVYYKNQENINSILNPVKMVNAHIHKIDNSGIEVAVGNIHALPIEVHSISVDDKMNVKPLQKVILGARRTSEPIIYKNIKFPLGADKLRDEDFLSRLKVRISFLGSSNIKFDEIYSWPSSDGMFLENDFIRQNPNIEQFDFLIVDEIKKEIIIKSGNWDLTDSLIIPSGYTFICGVDTQLNLLNRSKILSYSPIKFIGRKDKPIVISSSDKTGQGLIVLNAPDDSRLEFVVFKDLKYPSHGRWKLTGAVTFYESAVQVDHCQFLNIDAEDALNIVRSQFNINKSIFKNSSSDALDVDFSDGNIIGSAFVHIGNDAIDFSGSKVQLHDIETDNVGDKSLSIGEMSFVEARNIYINDSEFGLVVKDYSKFQLDNCKVTNSRIAVALYQKKSEFGPAQARMDNLQVENTDIHYIVEEGSELKVDGEDIRSEQNEVKKILAKYSIK